MNIDKWKVLSAVQKEFEWDKWQNEIPYLQFDKDWLVRAIPPFACGIIRYNIKHKKFPLSHVSVYLDCYSLLGYMSQPYWEIYPISGDTQRYYINDTEELIKGIREALKQQKTKWWSIL